MAGYPFNRKSSFVNRKSKRQQAIAAHRPAQNLFPPAGKSIASGFSRGVSRPELPWALALNASFCHIAFLSFAAIKRKKQRKITAYENSLKIRVNR